MSESSSHDRSIRLDDGAEEPVLNLAFFGGMLISCGMALPLWVSVILIIRVICF